MKKYNVSIDTASLMLNKRTSKTFLKKKDALAYCKEVERMGVSPLISIDTYKDGVCIRNEYAKYAKGNISIYDTINYKPRKKVLVKFDAADWFDVPSNPKYEWCYED